MSFVMNIKTGNIGTVIETYIKEDGPMLTKMIKVKTLEGYKYHWKAEHCKPINN